ncbi:MAG: hypothetical protein EP334_10095 [Gammaproteobacteria bacterium]|nr:MAG: hypothetical protein EP334_10095 [Gammaproteobacteria bacterium]
MSSVGQGVGAIVGGVIGFVASGGTPIGALKGAAYGAAIGGVIDPADLPGYEGPRLSDASEQTSGYGVGLVEADGKIRIAGHVFWIENNTRKQHVHKEDVGGKGGGGSQESVTYSYTGTFAVMLCDHQIQGIERLWDVKGLVLNTAGTDVDTALATSDVFPLAHLYNSNTEDQLKAALQVNPTPGPNGQIRLYPGFDDQMPDPRMEADLGVGNCPAYRGCAYLVFYDWPLPDEYGKSIAGASFSAEVIVNGSDGSAVLLNEIQIDVPAGYQNAACQYLTPSLSRVYMQDGPSDPADPPGAFLGLDVGPHGYQPGNPVYTAFSVGDQTTGKGLTDTDIGPIGLSDAVDLVSAFPGRPSISDARFYRQGSAGTGVWFAITSGGTLYVGFEETDSYDTLSIGGSPIEIAMDDDGNGIVLFNNSIKIYDQSLTLLRTIDTTSTIGSGMSYGFVWMTYDSATLWIGKSAGNHPGYIYPFDLDTETIGTVISLRDLDTTVYPGSIINADYANFNVSGSILTRYTLFTSGGPSDALIEHYRLPSPGATGEGLATVVRRRLERCELIQPSDIDVTDLTGTVRGYKTQGVGSVRQRVEPLMLAHQFDLIMSGYTLKAVMRGNSSVMTIDPDDLDCRPYGSQPGTALTQSREMDTQLPSVVVVKHPDKDRDYEVNEQRSQAMPSSASINVREVVLTEVMTPDEAAGVAEILWVRSWMERTPLKFSLPRSVYGALEAADVVTLPMAYATYELYLNSVNYTVDNRMELEAVPNDAATYTPNAVGSGGSTSVTTVTYGGNSVLIPLDIPPIKDAYNTYGYVAAMCGYSASWPGGVLVRSIDNGQTWQPIQGFAGAVVAGVVETPLGQDDGYVVNYTDQLTVQFFSSDMSISSITEAQMMTGMNWAAYGVDGRWEILLFANATDNGDGTWTLDTILRGAKGTEWAAGLHEAYDYFVFVSDADTAFIGVDVNNLGVERLLRGVTTGQDIDSVSNQAFTYAGANLKPYAPVQLDANLSGSDWVITWKRRTRLETSYFTNGAAVPLGEAAEAYEIDIIDTGVSPNVVVRSLEASSETVTYTAAQQTTDFGSAPASFAWRVRMMSAIVGGGYYSAEATV